MMKCLLTSPLLTRAATRCPSSTVLRPPWHTLRSTENTAKSSAAVQRRMVSVASLQGVQAFERTEIATDAAFLAPSAITFETLGLSAELQDAAHRAGYTRPAQAQSIAVPAALKGGDFILAAETGSGKTLAYLLPLIQSLKQRQHAMKTDRPTAPAWFHHCAVVLCPNMALCEQVVNTAASLTDPAGTPLATCAVVSMGKPPGVGDIDIVVSTPAALVNFLLGYGESYGRAWTPDAMAQRIRHLVADEADLLVSNPTYWDPLVKFMDLLRSGERAFTGRAVEATTGFRGFSDLKREYKMAAFRHGFAGMAAEGWKVPEGDLEEVTEVPADIWVGAPHRCRSYSFVAATMPRGGGKSVVGDLRRRFPDLEWLQGAQLHFSKAGVSHSWIRVKSDEEVPTNVIAALQNDDTVQKRLGQVLVFCSDVQSCTALHGAIASVGLRVLLYHKKVPMGEQAKALALMRSEEGWIMVCTDAAARGLDLPSVRHVIQAEFAENAIDFLHRIGRTGRAGRSGKITSLYKADRSDLAIAIKNAVDSGEPVEGAFSRNRSFAHKFRKHGKFVPRGEVCSDEDTKAGDEDTKSSDEDMKEM